MLDVVPVAQRSGRGHCDFTYQSFSQSVTELQRTSCSRGHCDYLALSVVRSEGVSYRGHHAREGIATIQGPEMNVPGTVLQRTSCSRGHCDCVPGAVCVIV